MSGLNPVPKSGTDLDLSWQENTVSEQDSYSVRYQGQYREPDWITFGITKDTKTYISGLVPGEMYTYEVVALSNGVRSEPVNETAVQCK